MSEEFDNISPYNEQEAVAAFARVAKHPFLPIISKYLFPELPYNALKKMILSVNSIDEFQQLIMTKAIVSVVDKTSAGLEYDGIDYLRKFPQKKFLAISNHRDIILDPAITQWMLADSNVPTTEICVGSNLLSSQLIEDLLRSNRMIKVIRGISARELYLSSQRLSKYIRESITSGRASVWIAQREGRTKNGMDTTEQGLLKMFDMSGEGSFEENFGALNILPLSISYEYEPCDAKKAREILISRNQKYVKKKGEDLHSILTGIRQWKGGIHLTVNKPITADEIKEAASHAGNDRYQALRHLLDQRINSGYKLWKTNYIAYDLMNHTTKYSDMYTPEELDAFQAYTEHKISKIEKSLDRQELRDTFWHIYGNPVVSKEKLQ